MGEILAASLLFAVVFQASEALRCDRTPEGASGPRSMLTDNRYIIEVSGNPETYVPGEQYKIHLKSNPDYQAQYKFKDFFLLVEHEQSEKTIGGVKNPSVGSLQLFGDMLTKFSDKCKNAVTATNALPKFEIQVLWTAPPALSGCVAIRATIVESRELWYSDDGPLSKVLCEEITENDDIQPNILTQCCACDEAKYEVTFEGMWSRNTHPKDFPQNNWLTKFSDIIGASHSINYTFWNYGEISSEGLRSLAENGATRMLESELKAKSEHIRTIIKARGISYPNITGKTFAVFRVDNKHHLMSLVSMIMPSPDWIVGVSSYELCLRNCSWVESRTLKLYPYDAGTDDGFTYMSADTPSRPRQPIRRIKSNSPNDPRSPFYDPTGAEIPPLAKLHLSRQRLYEKACDNSNMEPDLYDEDCELEEWSEWSECSHTCGKGVKYRQRAYKDKSGIGKCKKSELTQRAMCYGAQRHCRPTTHPKPLDPECELTDWSEWSTCSTTCGKGTKTRSRRYRNRSAAKKCAVMTDNPPLLEQNLECEEIRPGCSSEEMEDQDDCPVKWTEWSPCSASCGKGVKKRYRQSANPQIARSGIRYGYKQRPHPYASEDDDDDDGDETDDYRNNYYNSDFNCKKLEETVECVNDDMPTCDHEDPDASELPHYFSSENHRLPHVVSNAVGPVINCRVSRWSPWSRCIPLSGACGKGRKTKSRIIEVHPLNGGHNCPRKLMKSKKCNVACYEENVSNEYEDDDDEETLPTWGSANPIHEVKQDCVMSDWTKWSPCSVSCGLYAVQTRTRSILRHGTGGGKPCPNRVEKRMCNLLACPE